MKGLKRLVIDPKILIGRCLCPITEDHDGKFLRDENEDDDVDEEESDSDEDSDEDDKLEQDDGSDKESEAEETFNIRVSAKANLQPRQLLASLLPDSLEQLTLFIEREHQTNSVPRYREDLIEGLLAEKKSRLFRLRRVTFLEKPRWTAIPATVPAWGCDCDYDAEDCCRLYDEDATEREDQYQKMIKACAEVGIELKILGSAITRLVVISEHEYVLR